MSTPTGLSGGWSSTAAGYRSSEFIVQSCFSGGVPGKMGAPGVAGELPGGGGGGMPGVAGYRSGVDEWAWSMMSSVAGYRLVVTVTE